MSGLRRSTVRVTWQRVQGDAEAADRLLSSEVATLLGCAAVHVRVERRCRHCGSATHGRPVVLTDLDVPPPAVSLSRAPGIVLVAVGTDRALGVDVERLGAAGPAPATSAVLHAQEQAQDAAAHTRTWVRKESLLKATGDGLRVDPSLVRLSDPDQPPRLLEWPGPGEPPAVWMLDLDIEGHAACLSALGDQPAEVTLRQAGPAAVSA